MVRERRFKRAYRAINLTTFRERACAITLWLNQNAETVVVLTTGHKFLCIFETCASRLRLNGFRWEILNRLHC